MEARGEREPTAATERGAAAVEMALVLPLLVLLIGGIVDLGLLFNAQISLTHAAREGVRFEALDLDDPLGAAAAAYVAPGADWLAPSLRPCPHPEGARLEARAAYDFFFLPFGQRTLTGQAVMRCGG